MSKVVFELPDFDTGEYEDCEFCMKGDDAFLAIKIFNQPLLEIKFRKVRWHQFTSLYLCDVDWIKDCYFRLVDVGLTQELHEHIHKDPSPPYKSLHHYRIFLDETGCHEVFSESWEIKI